MEVRASLTSSILIGRITHSIFFIHRPLCRLVCLEAQDLRRHSGHNRIVRNVLANERLRANDHVVADGDAADNLRSDSDLNVVAKRWETSIRLSDDNSRLES